MKKKKKKEKENEKEKENTKENTKENEKENEKEKEKEKEKEMKSQKDNTKTQDENKINEKEETNQQAQELIQQKKDESTLIINSDGDIILLQSQLRAFFQQKKYNSLLNRYLITKELETTERNYLNFIKFLLFARKEIKKKQILNKEELRKIFGDLKPIYNFNKTLFSEIKKCLNPNNSNSTISESFSELIPYMGIYIPYINTYNQRFLEIEKLKTTNKNFSKYLDTIPKNKKSNGLRLESIMIMPIQRLPRYTLLLRELIKYSKEDEKRLIEKTMKKIHIMTSKINEKKRSFENIMALYQIDQKLIVKNNFKLMSPSRYFIGKLNVVFMTTHIHVECVLLLFNDILLLCVIEKPIFFWKRGEEFYQLHYVFNLNRIKALTNLVNNNGGRSFSFHHKKNTFQFKFNKSKFDLEKTNLFLEKLKDAMSKRKEIIKKRKKVRKIHHEKTNISILIPNYENEKKNERQKDINQNKNKNKKASNGKGQNKIQSDNLHILENEEFVNDEEYNEDEDFEILKKNNLNSKKKRELLKKTSSWSLISNYDIPDKGECEKIITQINKTENINQYNQKMQPVMSMVSQVLNQTWLFTKK
ncbi:faciogenital dysplasia protein [Anaeramoeba flamelloides]|uniref:Faciogenital dysplasia protein n=1 Tax=Anaeramoeba flamelloides TaxID=1746091 RepID=A0ABQ8Z514_9EUKA|nr:faciogenital dysplasia protein [Anaeramoeba flamelloides]